jgi:hypothetical protein
MEADPMPDTMPIPVSRYFDAERHDDTRRLADFFAPDAAVKDEGHTHHGLEAIAAWKRASKAAIKYEVTPVWSENVGTQMVVTGRVEGDFPGSPVMLRYTFTLAGDRISALEIGS